MSIGWRPAAFLRRVRHAVDRRSGAAEIIWSVPQVGDAVVALTFDDGPSRWTEELLDLLQDHDAVATFFVLGASIKGHESVLRRTVLLGHEVGSHTQRHPDLAKATDEVATLELRSGADAIAEVIGMEPRLVRPPYGAAPERVARLAGRLSLGPVVMWSIDPADWNQQKPEPIVAEVLARLEPGAIVDLHDGIPPGSRGAPTRRATVEAVAELLPQIRDRGYRCVTISQLVQAAA